MILRAENLARTFGTGSAAAHALVDASLSVDRGELVVIRGRSGSGKTTLLTLLGGLDTPDAGRIWWDEQEIAGLNADDMGRLRRTMIGSIFQSFALIDVLTAAENIELPLRVLGVDAATRDARVAQLLDQTGLAAHADQRPDELSGGQQQRVGVARALAAQPRLILADEPTGQLDSRTADSIMDLIVDVVRREGVSVVLATHDPRVADRADRVLELHDGVLRAFSGAASS